MSGNLIWTGCLDSDLASVDFWVDSAFEVDFPVDLSRHSPDAFEESSEDKIKR